MALTLVTNPVGSAASKIFAGFKPIEFIFKREDLAIIDIESGTGGIKINVTTDLTTYLSEGDSIYVYSEGQDYTYDGIGSILSITSNEITLDIPYIQSATGGYINYLKNYFVELQCISTAFDSVNLLPFSLQSDGDAAGNISIDVSIMNDINIKRGVIAKGLATESSKSFKVKYRQVYTGSNESFTVISDKILVVVFATETPETDVILNKLTLPKLFLGYQGAVAIARKGGTTGESVEMKYNELDINQISIANSTLGNLDAGLNGFCIWEWHSNVSVNDKTMYIQFENMAVGAADFVSPDFASPDFVTT
jgi:hypothetical protein